MSLFCCVFPLEVTLALLDAANDKDSEVQEQVRKSMLTLGKQQPDRVLAMCQDYLLKHPKVSPQNTPTFDKHTARVSATSQSYLLKNIRVTRNCCCYQYLYLTLPSRKQIALVVLDKNPDKHDHTCMLVQSSVQASE